MQHHDIVVIGASAGGLEALQTLVEALPSDLPAAIFVVQHLPAESVSLAPTLLNRAGRLPVCQPVYGEQIESGRIYLAPPDLHLLLAEPGSITLTHGPRVNLHRPSIDALFRSAARTYGARTIGVILTGTMDDGVAGLLAIKMRGGVALVQAPQDALYPELPQNVVDEVEKLDAIAPLSALAAHIAKFVHQPVREGSVREGSVHKGSVHQMPAHHDRTSLEAARPKSDGSASVPGSLQAVETANLEGMMQPGAWSGFSCPECGGVLIEQKQGELVRYECHTGHIFSIRSLAAAQAATVEEALWNALRALKEKAALAEKMAQRLQTNPHLNHLGVEYAAQAQQTLEYARIIQELLQQGAGEPASNEPA